MEITTVDALYSLQKVPGKGRSLVATTNIPKGTRILSEKPIITVNSDEPDFKKAQASIFQQVEALPEQQREAFIDMHNMHPFKNAAEQYLGIVRTNALPSEIEGDKAGIFLEACRINHACSSNAQKHWNENIKRHTVHALRNISKGEEITIYYLRVLNSYATRQEALKEKFGFECSCELCSLPLVQRQKSDERLKKIYKLDSLIGKGAMGGMVDSPLRFLRYVDEQVGLYNADGADDVGLPRAYPDAAQICLANGILARGRIFVTKAADAWRISQGSDTKEVIVQEALAREPQKHRLYRMSMSRKWQSSVDNVPSGLDTNEFEDWLWR